MVRALHLHFYGGVPQLIVPDNARTVIATSDRYETQVKTMLNSVLQLIGHDSRNNRSSSPKYAPG